MKAIVNNSCCQILYREKLPRKTVGKTIEVEFSADWEGLAITAVFEAGDVKKDVVYTGKPIIIPHEVLATEGLSVMLGFHGALPDGTIVKRTVPEWLNNVSASLDPSGETSSKPTPDWAAQVQTIALEAKEAADSVRSDAQAGKFNGSAGDDGGWYTPAVTQPGENTLRVAFTPSKEGMPAVADTDITLPAGEGGGFSPVISVTDFGAAGDGVTDDTAALQLAFDSTAVQGGNLYIPEGDYKITGQLTIADPICVSGDGCLKLYDPDSSAEFAALTVDNGVRLIGLTLEAQEGFAGVILKYYPTSNSIYPSRTRFKSLILQSLSTQKILSYFDVYGGNNYGLIIDDVTIGKPNTARYCQYGMRILTESGYAGAGASWENSGTVRNLRIDTRGDHQLYAVGASGGVVPKNWVFENIAIQANSKLQGGNAFTYQDSFYLYRFAEVTLRNCKV